MTIDPATAAEVTSSHKGQIYYFCHRSCLARFKEAPEKYVAPPSNRGAGGSRLESRVWDDDRPGHRGRSRRAQRADLLLLPPIVPGAIGSTEKFLSAAPAPAVPAPAGTRYICPMDPEVEQDHPGACPKCGMALEPEWATGRADAGRVPPTRCIPEIVRAAPGACPICGMALEPRTVDVADAPNPELADMTRRVCGLALLFGLPVFVLAMGDMVLGMGLGGAIDMRVAGWIGLVCATPVVLWAGLAVLRARLERQS